MRLSDIPAPAWALLGVLAGWVLGEGTRWVREIFRIRKLSAALRSDLISLLAQIKDKEDILLQGIQALKSKAVMPMLSVRSVRIGYGEFIKELYPHYSDLERNCLHVIYERLRVADEVMESAHTDLLSKLKDGVLAEPWSAHIGHLEELLASYDVVENLIKSFLNGKPEDVFHIAERVKADR